MADFCKFAGLSTTLGPACSSHTRPFWPPGSDVAGSASYDASTKCCTAQNLGRFLKQHGVTVVGILAGAGQDPRNMWMYSSCCEQCAPGCGDASCCHNVDKLQPDGSDIPEPVVILQSPFSRLNALAFHSHGPGFSFPRI